ncbi:MAG: glycosyltransferase [Chthonomonadaceae bacterium]|nr:glycosyltransferase [Chthonomonadaceae bacterium]
MSISVVIPTYNGEKYLSLTLKSVQAQTHTDWELIVIDDGSKDNSAALVETFAAQDSRIRVISQENGGIARARNRGIAEADPARPYLAFLDHDDLWEPTALADMVRASEALPGSVGAHGKMRIIDSDGNATTVGWENWYEKRKGMTDGKIRDWLSNEPTTFAVMALRSQIVTVGQVVMKKSAIEGCELFDPAMVPADDYDFWLRLLARGDLAFTDTVSVAWRKHDTNTSNNFALMISKTDELLSKVRNMPSLTPAQSRLLKEGTIKHKSEVAALRVDWARGSLLSGQPMVAAKHLRHALKSYLASRETIA